VRPMNGYYGAVVVAPSSERSDSVFVACRPSAKPDFDDGDLERLQLLAPHIGAAMRLRETLAVARLEAMRARDALDAADLAVILLDADGAPDFVSRRAERLLGENDALSLRGGQLGAATPAATRSLRRLIACAAERRLSEGDLSLSLPRPQRRRPLLARAAPLSRDAAEATGNSRSCVALFLCDPGFRDRLDEQAIAASYHLTPRESQVALAIARGADVACAGRSLGVSAGTVRTHLKAVFAKTGARRQSELVRLVLGLRP